MYVHNSVAHARTDSDVSDVDTNIPKNSDVSEIDSGMKLEQPDIGSQGEVIIKNMTPDTRIHSQSLGLIRSENEKLYFENPYTKQSYEISEYDTTTGIYKYKDESDILYEYNPNAGLISQYNMQGKPGCEVLKLTSQVVLDADGRPVEVRKKIKTDKNGNITSYKTYNADGTKILDIKEFYAGSDKIKKQTFYDNSDNPKIIREITYRENGSFKIIKDYDSAKLKFETEYKEDGKTILNKKIYNGNDYTQQNFDDNGRIVVETKYSANRM